MQKHQYNNNACAKLICTLVSNLPLASLAFFCPPSITYNPINCKNNHRTMLNTLNPSIHEGICSYAHKQSVWSTFCIAAVALEQSRCVLQCAANQQLSRAYKTSVGAHSCLGLPEEVGLSAFEQTPFWQSKPLQREDRTSTCRHGNSQFKLHTPHYSGLLRWLIIRWPKLSIPTLHPFPWAFCMRYNHRSPILRFV